VLLQSSHLTQLLFCLYNPSGHVAIQSRLYINLGASHLVSQTSVYELHQVLSGHVSHLSHKVLGGALSEGLANVSNSILISNAYI